LAESFSPIRSPNLAHIPSTDSNILAWANGILIN
jgi:hypothetical protein